MRLLSLFSVLAFGVSIANAASLKVASFSTITTDIAKNVGGDNITLFPIVKPGVDPHEFQPTPGDIREVVEANLVLVTGKGLEGYLTKLEETAPNATFVDCGAKCPSLFLEEEGKKIQDPHWWHSVKNVESATQVIEAALIKADPAHKADYEARAKTYLATLDDLDSWVKEQLAMLPRSQRKLVTSHDAFQYLAHDYGFTIYPIEGVSTEDEPSSKKVADLIQTIKDQNVKAVFFESIENPKVVDEITRESGAKIGGELYADGLGDKEATTYVDMVKHNITILAEGLK
jgi:ABC-type Zn uptake system ZnuABC Zn-binding protein ZnuA